MARNADQFNCETCKEKFCDAARALPGSLGAASYPKWAIDDIGFESRVCLLPMITDLSNYLLSLYEWFDMRILPFKGGLLDQPYFFIESMKIIRNYLQKQYERERAKNGNH